MEYEWDKAKAKTNRAKHGVSFADAVAVFEDAQALAMPDDDPDEERHNTIGMDAFGRILVVVYTWRTDAIRIISARKANPSERSAYGGS